MTEAEAGDDPNRLLHTLRETLISEFRSKQPDLTLRQLALVLLVYRTDKRQTVRGLAAHLNVSKTSISRALNQFERTGLANRKIDLRDRRSVFVGQTVRGDAMVERLGAAMAEAANKLGETPLQARDKGAHAALCATTRAESSKAMPEQPRQTIDDGAYQSQVFFEEEDADLDELHPTEWLILHIAEDDIVAQGWAATPRAAQVAAAKALAETIAKG